MPLNKAWILAVITKDTLLHIFNASAGTVAAAADTQLTIESSGATGISFLSPNTAVQALFFGDSDDNDVGSIRYNHSGNSITFASGGSDNFTMTASAFNPSGAGSISSGDGSTYWNDISYKTLTDRGCLPFCDEGVELIDGRVVSDCEALLAIKKHPTKQTIQGLPMLDYKTFPKKSYKKADSRGKILPRDENDEPIGGHDGVEMTMLFGVMIGAIKELHSRLKKVEGE